MDCSATTAPRGPPTWQGSLPCGQCLFIPHPLSLSVVESKNSVQNQQRLGLKPSYLIPLKLEWLAMTVFDNKNSGRA